MSDPQAQAEPPPQKTFRLATKLLVSFGLICGTLLTLGGLFFFSLRSIEKSNASERSSVWIEISQLHRAANTLGELQAEVFRHVVASAPAELMRRKEAIAQLAQINTEIVSSYGRFTDNPAKKRLFARLLEAGRIYRERTQSLLATNRTDQNGCSRPRGLDLAITSL